MQAPPETLAMLRPVGTPNMPEADVFPPLRAQAPDPSIFLPYTTEDIAFEDEYEEYLSDLGLSSPHGDNSNMASDDYGVLFGGTSVWQSHPHFRMPEMSDGMSDTDSIGSIAELGDEANKLDVSIADGDKDDENRNNWEVSHTIFIYAESKGSDEHL